MKTKDGPATTTPDLRKYAWLAIAAAMLTVLLKGSAWAITGSVSLLSDAAESMVNLVAAILNGVVGQILIKVGTRHRSITLRADGRHLMTDVYTTVGVVVGLGLAWMTGWNRLDPVIAILVGVNILVTGYRLITESTAGLMDASLSAQDNARIHAILDAHAEPGRIEFHAVRTRESGARQFMEMHMLVPGDWTVQRGHDAMEDLVEKIVAQFPAMRVTGHLEPVSDPRSYEDMSL